MRCWPAFQTSMPSRKRRPPLIRCNPEGLESGWPWIRHSVFIIPDNLDALTAAGAELVPFSPIADARLPEGLGGIYFGGGYPELHAEKLAANSHLRSQVLASSLKGMPIYAECGGLMYLCRELTDMDGRIHPMTGCFSFSTRMLQRLKTLGYREITLKKDTILGQAGRKIRGHEFHYSEIIPPADVPGVYAVTSRFGESEDRGRISSE